MVFIGRLHDDDEDDIVKSTLSSFIQSIDKKGKDSIIDVLIIDVNLKEIPPFIFDLKNLETLSVSHCNLSVVSDDIIKLKNLKKLWIGGNRFIKFPRILSQLKQLTQLNIDYCKIERVPKCIGKLTLLEHLDISSNQILTLPETMINLTNLKIFICQYNDFDMPDFILKLPNLKLVKWTDNDSKKHKYEQEQSRKKQKTIIF